MLKRSIGISFLGLMALSLAAPTQDAVSLRRELVEGTKDVYTIETSGDSAIDIGGQQVDSKMTTSMTYAITVGKVDSEKGLAEVETLMSDIKFTAEGPTAAMMGGQDQMPKEIKASGKLDSLGRYSEMKVQGASAQMVAGMGATSMTSDNFVSLPEKPVKKGDSWDVVVSKQKFFGDKEQKLSATYVSDDEVDKVKAVKLALKGNLPIDFDLGEMLSADPESGLPPGLKIPVKGTMGLTGTAFVNKANGRIISVDVTMAINSTMELPGGAAPGTVKGNAKSSMKLKK